MLSPEEAGPLDGPVSFALTGIGMFFILHLIVLIHFLKFVKFSWLEDMHRAVALGTLPFVMLAAAFLFHFYLKFYQFLSIRSKKFIPDGN